MKEFIAITKALADESRVRLLLALEERELCVCQLIELLGLAPSTVSKHMSILKQAGLVDMRKEGRWAYYRVAGGDSPVSVTAALQLCLLRTGNMAGQRHRHRKPGPLHYPGGLLPGKDAIHSGPGRIRRSCQGYLSIKRRP